MIFTTPQALTRKSMLKVMQNFKLDFLGMNFRSTRVYVLSSISRTLHYFSTGFFSVYRGMLGLQNDTRILHKNVSFKSKMLQGSAALFIKMKIYFFCCNLVNNQINSTSQYLFLFELYAIGRAQNIPENACSFGNETPNQWVPPKNHAASYQQMRNTF